jgi:class 3 adenylate cyclase
LWQTTAARVVSQKRAAVLRSPHAAPPAPVRYEAATLFSALRQAADPEVVSAIEAMVRDAPDRHLSRTNALDFSAKLGLGEDRAIAAALHIRAAMGDLNQRRHTEDMLLKIGIHEGPCLAVTLNDRQDYFGQTVTIASRVQALAMSHSILATGSIVDHPQSTELLQTDGIKPTSRRLPLRGIADEVAVYEIP